MGFTIDPILLIVGWYLELTLGGNIRSMVSMLSEDTILQQGGMCSRVSFFDILTILDCEFVLIIVQIPLSFEVRALHRVQFINWVDDRPHTVDCRMVPGRDFRREHVIQGVGRVIL